MTFFKRYLEFSLTIFTINFLLIVVNLITLFISIFVLRQFICRELRENCLISHDVASGSIITPCNKIDKQVVVYRL